jgi:hypothetical protein
VNGFQFDDCPTASTQISFDAANIRLTGRYPLLQLQLVRHLWGVDLSNGLAPHVAHWHDAGYTTLEASTRTVPDAAKMRQTIKAEGFGWISQVFSNMFVPGGTVSQHLHSLKEQIDECLDDAPLFFNCHSGSDAWTSAEAEDFYGAVIEMEKRIGITLAHETHRSRYFGNPWNTHRILKRFPELKLTCDLSHWVCVAERLLEDCADIISLCARQCWHLHARVGYEEGPQVPDPRAPEWKAHLNVHEAWWDKIWQAQQANGMKTSTLTPEFGPPPYLHTIPYTQEPVANLNAICDWMAHRQRERFLARAG